MGTINYLEETLPESDDVSYPMAKLVDDGSIYPNFISIETLSEDENDDDQPVRIVSRVRPSQCSFSNHYASSLDLVLV